MEYVGICANKREDANPAPENYPAHSHGSYELFLPLSGACEFEVADNTFTAPRGSVMLFAPDEPHRLLVRSGQPLAYLYVQFTPDYLPPDREMTDCMNHLFDEHPQGASNLRMLGRESFAYLQATLNRLCQVRGEHVREDFYRILRPALIEIAQYGTPISPTLRMRTSKPTPKSTLVDEIAEYIATHYAVIEDLSFVREQFHYSAVHVNTLFRQQLGVSLWRYVMHIRLDRACDMLRSGMRAEEVSAACGFHDYSTFYRIFKKCYGITPTACKKCEHKPKLLQ
jgi:AraC-like DNA-binding protein